MSVLTASIWSAQAPDSNRPFDHRLRHIVALVKWAGGSADALSYARIALSFVFIACLFYVPWLAVVVTLVDGITDLTDGPFARLHGSSDKGWFIDPICDKVSSGANMLAISRLVELEFDLEIGGISLFWTTAIVFMVANFTNEWNRIALIRRFGWKRAGELSRPTFAGKTKVWFVAIGNGLMAIAYATTQAGANSHLAMLGALIAGIGIAAVIPYFRYRWAAWLGLAILFASSFEELVPCPFNLGLALGQVALIGYMGYTVLSVATQIKRRRAAS